MEDKFATLSIETFVKKTNKSPLRLLVPLRTLSNWRYINGRIHSFIHDNVLHTGSTEQAVTELRQNRTLWCAKPRPQRRLLIVSENGEYSRRSCPATNCQKIVAVSRRQ